MQRWKCWVVAATIPLAGLMVFWAHRTPPREIPAADAAERLAIVGGEAELLSEQHVTIPEPDAVSADYVRLQAVQRLPLTRHIGSEGVVCTYRLPGSPFRAELLCADGVLIGAQVYLPEDAVSLPFPFEEKRAPS